MATAKTFQNTIAGVVVKSTPLYARWLNFDRVIKYVVEAVNYDPEPDENGIVTYRYTSAVKTTSPYRVMLFRPHQTPNQMLYITDLPATSGGIGLVTVTFENFYLFPELEQVKKDKASGAMYTVEKPRGW